MQTRLFLALACLLVAARLPSLEQPMGADQGLYAYVGERILAGELPYRHAWDQKPPAVHYTYAVLRAAWPHQGVAAAADLLMAVLIAGMLLALGTRLAGAATGRASALIYLFLSDPNFQRLGGVSVRAQCETFIAGAVTAGFLLLGHGKPTPWKTAGAGLMLGLAVSFKYNAILYGAAFAIALWTWGRLTLRELALLAAGAVAVPLVLFSVFAVSGSVHDLYYATIEYNLQYSGETYASLWHFVGYLFTFPLRHAQVDALWLVGGAGCAVLIVTGVKSRERWIAPAWVAAACLTIAINGSRGLPQYFVQALPALALSAAWGGSLLWTRKRVLNAAALLVLMLAIWRVNDFTNLAGNIAHDTQYRLGRMTRQMHLARYGDREQRKYSALAMTELAEFIRARTRPEDRIYVFGFASGTYVQADRASASRFFWSRPVIVDFNASHRGYGVEGLRADLEQTQPAVVALQVLDWWPDVQNSAEFFMSTPRLAGLLHAGYTRVQGPAGFEIWERRRGEP